MRRVLAICGVLAIAASCGNSDQPSQTKRSETSSKQAASIVARHATAIRDALSFEDTCHEFDCLVATARFARYDRMATKGSDLGTDLRSKEPYDDEVSELVNETLKVTDTLVRARAATNACFDAHQGGTLDDCHTEVVAYETAWRALGPALDAWNPYM